VSVHQKTTTKTREKKEEKIGRSKLRIAQCLVEDKILATQMHDAVFEEELPLAPGAHHLFRLFSKKNLNKLSIFVDDHVEKRLEINLLLKI